MPTYQYACSNGHQVEVVQAFTDDPLTTCPECGAQLRKVFSAVGIVFKGSGFYRTDSRNGSKAPATEKAGADKSSGTSDKPAADGSGAKSGSDKSSTSASSGSSTGSDSSGSASSGSGKGKSGTSSSKVA